MAIVAIRPELLVQWYASRPGNAEISLAGRTVDDARELVSGMIATWLKELPIEEQDAKCQVSHALFNAFYTGKVPYVTVSVHGDKHRAMRVGAKLIRAFGGMSL